MPGHIQLGAVGGLRDYMIANLNLYTKAPANQFAAKLSTGGGNYDDLQNWSYFVMDDWRAGVGKKDPEAGGFLYSDLETRYPNRLTLPNALSLVTNEDTSTYPLNSGWQAGKDLYPTTELIIGTTQAVQAISKGVNGVTGIEIEISLWLKNEGTSVTVSIYSDSGDLPNAALGSATLTTQDKTGSSLYATRISGLSLSTGTKYHIVVAPQTAGQTITLPMNGVDVDAADLFATYNGSSWSNYTAGSFLHGVAFDNINLGLLQILYFPANGRLYAINSGDLYRRTDDDSDWVRITGLSTPSHMCVVGDELWIGNGNSTNFVKMDSGESLTAASVPARILLRAQGYVWRFVEGDAYYTADGTTWDGPIAVTWGGFEIRSAAVLNDFVYCATDDGLYYIGFGDYVGHVTNWPSIDATNGLGMINHQGTLFIPVQQSLYRYDGQTMLPVGLDQGEGLPQDRIGIVKGLVSLNNWLLAFVTTIDTAKRSTIWAYNDQGWHYLSELPNRYAGGYSEPGAMTYDINSRKLYIAMALTQIYELPIADSANFNNISAYPTPKMPNGWLETDWFYGNLLEVYKDCESLYITGEGIDSSHPVKVYWQDDDSTDWELLGTVTNNRTELRWSDYTTRPNTRQIKIGLLLETRDDDAPIVRGVRLKYHPMVSDWFRWSFPIMLSDNQELMDGELNTYNREEMEEHLDSLIKQVPAFLLRDINNKEYEVKVMGCQVQVASYEYLADGPHYDLIYNLTVEQIRPDEYTAS